MVEAFVRKMRLNDFWHTSLMNRFLQVSLLLAIMLVALPPAKAFSIDTHVWIAQTVIDDLLKGDSVEFPYGDKKVRVAVPPHVSAAILGNRAQFRLGSIGPDAFPGIFEGQMTIHPGSDGKAWGTGEWLAHVLESAKTPAEIAFAYGYLIHAASDTFAHTYVNQYAGDVYLLTDGEVDVERRHFTLESYISQRLPVIVGIANMADQIRADAPALPLDFLRGAFIGDAKAAKQFAANSSGHFAAVHNLNQALKTITKKDGPLDRLHLEVQKLGLLYYTGIKANEADLKALNDAHQSIRNVTNDGVDRLQEFDQRFRGEANKVLGAAHKAEAQALQTALELLAKIQSLHSDKQKFERDVAKAASDLHEWVDPVDTNIKKACRFVIDLPCVVKIRGNKRPHGCGKKRKACRDVTEKVSDLRDRSRLKNIVREKQGLENNAIAHLTDTLENYKSTIAQVHQTAMSIRTTEGQILHGSIDLIQSFAGDIDPIKSIALNWIASNDKAMDAYFLANLDAVQMALRKDDMLVPLRQWADCHAPALLGVPSQVLTGKCSVKNMMAEIEALFDKLEALAASVDPVLKEIVRVRTEVKTKIREAVTDELVKFAGRMTGVDIEQLASIMKLKPSKKMIDDEFAKSTGKKKLIDFVRISDRIDAEMRLDGTGKFSPTEYAVIANAITLSKLALLDADGLNQLLKSKRYSGAIPENSNIMFRFASSIDGNHPWLPQAPPYARQIGKHKCGKENGYSNGFHFWGESAPRRTAFNKLFIGPLSPGLEIPRSLGLSRALPSDYPYSPNRDDPFPSELWNNDDCVSRPGY
jgi:hypothetical protein